MHAWYSVIVLLLGASNQLSIEIRYMYIGTYSEIFITKYIVQ